MYEIIWTRGWINPLLPLLPRPPRLRPHLPEHSPRHSGTIPPETDLELEVATSGWLLQIGMYSGLGKMPLHLISSTTDLAFAAINITNYHFGVLLNDMLRNVVIYSRAAQRTFGTFDVFDMGFFVLCRFDVLRQ